MSNSGETQYPVYYRFGENTKRLMVKSPEPYKTSDYESYLKLAQNYSVGDVKFVMIRVK